MINIYCDESCHLPKDNSEVMILGGISCAFDKNKVNQDIRNIKKKHGLSTWFEIKWTKVSIHKIEFYKEVIDYFFVNDLCFRGIVAKDKKKLNHKKYNDGSYTIYGIIRCIIYY